MSQYVPLLRFSVRHRYFGGNKCSPLEFVPTAACDSAMRKNGLLLRAEGNSFTIYCGDDQQAALRRPSDTDEGSLMLAFKVFPRDRNFARYTNPLASTRDDVLYLDSWRAVDAPDGRKRLHQDESVGDSYFEDWASPLVQSLVTRHDAVVRPFLIINLSVNDGVVPSTAPPEYYAEFASYASYWKYYFVGDIAKRDLAITDLNGKVEFTSLGMTEVASGEALTFVSKDAIPMQDMPQQRFQLLENGEMGEKVLIKRLPNAAVGQVSKAQVEETQKTAVLVSEMYIN